MNFDEFVTKYKGKRIEFDNVSYYQCVDLVKFYARDVLGLKFGAFGNAKDYFYNYRLTPTLYDNFTKIANTATFVPIKGDIVIWKNGKYGHIAVATGEGNTSWFKSFDQNYGIDKRCRIVKHNYKGFLGVLRPNNQNAIVGNLYKAGEAVETNIPIVIAYQGSDKSIVEYNGQQFWLHNSVIKGNKIVARGMIAYAENKNYIIDILGTQFWVKEKDILKKL